MKTYKVTAERHGKWWILDAPEADAFTQVSNLAVAQEWIREAISMMLDVPEDSFDVVVEVALPKDELAELRAIKTAQAQAARLQQETADRARALIARLESRGLKRKEIGQVLGVSHQRVSQLAA